MEAIVLCDPAGSPDDAGHKMGVCQLLKLCSLNQLGWGPLWLLGHTQGPGSFCGWVLLGRVKCRASWEEAESSGVSQQPGLAAVSWEDGSPAPLHPNSSV